MKLISCHIDNFGTLSGRSFNFSKSVTSFCEANGSGKSTLAEFLCAMFYGFPRQTTDEKTKTRSHYAPFNQGAYGGSLIFEINGYEYRIERHFSEKGPSNDTFIIYKNNLPTKEYDSDIGLQVFGLDRDAFRRTVFVADNDLKLEGSSALGKLTGTAGDIDEDSTDEALKALEKKAKEYQPKRGNNGQIPQDKEAIHNIEVRLNEISEKEHDCIGHRNELQKKETELARYQARSKALTNAALRNKDLERLKEYENEVDKSEAEISEIKKKYPLGIPTAEEQEQIEKTISDIGTQNAFLGGTDSVDVAEYTKLKNRFLKGVPSREEMDSIEKTVEEIEKTRIQTQGGANYSDYEQRIRQHFSGTEINDKEAEKIKSIYGSFKDLEKKRDGTPEFISNQSNEQPKNNKGAISTTILISIGTFILMLGVFCCFESLVAGIIVGSFGLSILLLSIILKSVIKKKQFEKNRGDVNPEFADLNLKTQCARVDLLAELHKYKFDLKQSPDECYNDFASGYEAYKSFIKADDAKESKKNEIEKHIKERQEKLDSFFDKYQVEGLTNSERLFDLKNAIKRYGELQQSNKERKEKIENAKKRIEEDKALIQRFKIKFSILVDLDVFLKTASEDRSALAIKEKNHQDAVNKYQSFKTEIGTEDQTLDESDPLNSLSKEEIENSISGLNQDIADLRNTINDLENEVSERDSLENKKTLLEEGLQVKIQKYERLIKASEYIESARQEIIDKYVTPVQKTFTSYASALEKALGACVVLNGKFELQMQIGGKLKPDLHFSEGQKAICSLCMRLSLIDSIFKDETPFIVLDDPFVSLDEEHLERAKDLLNKLATNHQIVYFTCHESRKLSN